MTTFPSELGACIDRVYAVRAKRLAYQRKHDAVIDLMKKEEQALEEHILNTFGKSEIEGAKGKKATAAISRSTVASVQDWDAFFAYVAKKKAFDLLQKRVNNSAYRERLEAKAVVPGVEPYVALSLSITKR
jgi:hypothetical protein